MDKYYLLFIIWHCLTFFPCVCCFALRAICSAHAVCRCGQGAARMTETRSGRHTSQPTGLPSYGNAQLASGKFVGFHHGLRLGCLRCFSAHVFFPGRTTASKLRLCSSNSSSSSSKQRNR